MGKIFEYYGADPMNGKDAAIAVEFIEAYWKEIVEKWVTFFIYKQAVSSEVKKISCIRLSSIFEAVFCFEEGV